MDVQTILFRVKNNMLPFVVIVMGHSQCFIVDIQMTVYRHRISSLQTDPPVALTRAIKLGDPSPVTGSQPGAAAKPFVPQPGLEPTTTSLKGVVPLAKLTRAVVVARGLEADDDDVAVPFEVAFWRE